METIEIKFGVFYRKRFVFNDFAVLCKLSQTQTQGTIQDHEFKDKNDLCYPFRSHKLSPETDGHQDFSRDSKDLVVYTRIKYTIVIYLYSSVKS